jgi:hypothetical protein
MTLTMTFDEPNFEAVEEGQEQGQGQEEEQEEGQQLDLQDVDIDTIIIENVLGSIQVAGIRVYVIQRTTSNNINYSYITDNLDMRIPIGLVIHLPGYNEPYIYFDEVEGPRTFPYFSENMFNQSLNWVDINIGTYDEVINTRELFENAKAEAHNFLNQIIQEAQDQINDVYEAR